MVSSAAFLKLPYMIKLTLLSIMAIVYVVLVKTIFANVFSRQESCGISLLDTGYGPSMADRIPCMELDSVLYIPGNFTNRFSLFQ